MTENTQREQMRSDALQRVRGAAVTALLNSVTIEEIYAEVDAARVEVEPMLALMSPDRAQLLKDTLHERLMRIAAERDDDRAA